jgi:hypothetical protein
MISTYTEIGFVHQPDYGQILQTSLLLEAKTKLSVHAILSKLFNARIASRIFHLARSINWALVTLSALCNKILLRISYTFSAQTINCGSILKTLEQDIHISRTSPIINKITCISICLQHLLPPAALSQTTQKTPRSTPPAPQ